MIAALGLIGTILLSLLVLIARGLLTDEIKGRIQHHTRAHLDATVDALPAELRASWEDEWRAELDAKLAMPLTAWRLVRGIRRVAGELVADTASAAAQAHDAPHRRDLPITPTPQRASATPNKHVRVWRVGDIVRVVGNAYASVLDGDGDGGDVAVIAVFGATVCSVLALVSGILVLGDVAVAAASAAAVVVATGIVTAIIEIARRREP